ncbi:hypothetical protein L208DRAFT_1202497, partial [Tricholoma matsutake]
IFRETPALIAFDMSQYQTSLSNNIVVTTVDGQCTTYKLRGVIYHLNDHLTSHFITESGSMWYHDGISTGHKMENEGDIVNIPELGTCRLHVATCAVY